MTSSAPALSLPPLLTASPLTEKLTVDHIREAKTWSLVKGAEIYYVESFFLNITPESVLEVTKNAAAEIKIFIPQSFTEVLGEILPYLDVVFGNEIKKPKANTQRERLVVFTQVANCTIVAKTDGTIEEYPIIAIPHTKIVNCNGAGDAFCGVFVAKLVQDADIATAVAKGHYLAHQVIQQSGPTYPRNLNQD
ncbi:hypothetical protein EMPS_11569 [Entomortierella parvispora]|uniref:Adenosine kinase n=1 Tax=Entomortierella parvispora TaxID=205924 RepID=A0A9P3M2X4_9FUNG|nr:hypothetical protein EMPS_11569 [Entomortierella parvispora]